jgi:hypothetical protein
LTDVRDYFINPTNLWALSQLEQNEVLEDAKSKLRNK